MILKDLKITDNSDLVGAELRMAVERALERCGMAAESFAVELCPVDTGNLRGSITHRVDTGKQEAWVGTNVEYAPYVELGTGIYYPGGRPTPWSYQDADGKWHRTSGHEPQPFIKPAVADHAQTYRNIIKDEMGGGEN